MRNAIASIVIVGLLAASSSVHAQVDQAIAARAAKVAKADSVLSDLEQLPEGLRVAHSPNPALAAEDSTGGKRFIWKYATSVSALTNEVTIVEFGMLFQAGEQWVFANYTGKPFGAKEFAAWYGCDGARVREGETYSDPSNWSSSNCLKDGIELWYFIGEDAAGRRVQGSAEIRQAAELISAKSE